jgi:hypothetical protein
MSRVCANTNADHLDLASNLGVTTVPLSQAVWYKRTAAGSGTQRLITHGTAGSTDNHWALNINVATDGVRAETRTTGGNNSEAASHPVDSTWRLAGSSFAANNNRIGWAGDTPGTPETTTRTPVAAGINLIRIGNSPATAFPSAGKFAHMAEWATALVQGDWTRLAAGVNPLNVKPWALLEYFELTGTGLTGLVTGAVLVASGTTVDAADNPTINAAVTPAFSVAPSVTAPTTDGYTVGFTANTDCTVHVVALLKNSSAPNAAAVIAGTGAVATATKNVTGADTVTLTGLVFPCYDLYAVVTSLAGTSAVASMLAQYKSPPTGKQYSTFTSVDPDTKYALVTSPSIAAGDVREIPLAFPDGTLITPSSDGNDVFPWDGSAKYYIGRAYDDSAQGWFALTMPDGSPAPDEYFEVSFGDQLPVRIDPELDLVQQLTLDVPMTSVDVADFIRDPEGTALTFVLLSALPPGMAFNAGVFSGTPSVTDTYILNLRAYDAHGGAFDFAFTFLVGRPLVPNFVGMSFDEAAALLEEQFFILGVSSYTITELYDPGTVLAQDPPAGTEVDRFSTISFTLAQAVPVPVVIRVQAYQEGFFGGYQRKVGDIFELLAPEEYSPYWMTLLDTPPFEWTHLLEDFDPEVERMILKQPTKTSNIPEPFRSVLEAA